MVSLLLAFIYLAFVTLGLPDSVLGSCWPLMHKTFNVDIGLEGIVTMTISFGTIISSLFSDKLLRKVKTEVVELSSVFLTAIALFGFSICNKFYQVLLFSIPYGLGAGAIDASLNSYVALHYKGKHMSFLHAFWGLGCIISPYIMSYAIFKENSWNLGYRLVSMLQFMFFIILLFSIPLWKKVRESNKDNKKEEVIPNVLTLKEKFKIKNIFFILIGFFGYCAMEATMFNWTSSYLVNYRGLSVGYGAMFQSLFFIGLTSGRIVSGIIGQRIENKNYIRIGLAFTLIGIILILLPFNEIIALIGIVVMGFGNGPIYPSIISSTPSNFSKENTEAVIGLEMSSAYIGSTFMPPLFGIIASKVSIALLPVYVLIFYTLLVVMTELLNKRNKEKNLCAVDAI